MSGIKPCPFCGKPGVLREHLSDYWVTCSDPACPVGPETGTWGDELSPQNDWNDRPEVGRWVSANGSLPDITNGDVLVWKCNLISQCRLSTNRKFWIAGNALFDTSDTYWTPLLEPPKGEK